MIAYTLQYIDRSAMSYAAVFSFRTDLDLVGTQYSWLGSCFFLGYLFFEFPGSQVSPLTSLHFILLTHVQIHPATSSSLQNHGNINRHMGRSPDVLGCPSFLRGAAAIRTLLGCSEALVTPGFVLLISRFYKREEQPLRVGLWYCCNGLGSFIGALVSFGMGHIHVDNVPNWAWIFIFKYVPFPMHHVVIRD